jgi:hypothetical protein
MLTQYDGAEAINQQTENYDLDHLVYSGSTNFVAVRMMAGRRDKLASAANEHVYIFIKITPCEEDSATLCWSTLRSLSLESRMQPSQSTKVPHCDHKPRMLQHQRLQWQQQLSRKSQWQHNSSSQRACRWQGSCAAAAEVSRRKQVSFHEHCEP